MAGPFKINEPPAKNENARKEPLNTPYGKNIVKTRDTGVPLPDGNKDGIDKEAPIAWGPAQPGADHKPFKNTK